MPAELEGYLYRQTGGSTVINSCDVYTDSGWLTVEAPGDELAEEPAWAWVHVFNYGAPMVLGRTRLGESLALGPGDFLVTTEVAGRAWSGLASIRPGEETTLSLKPELYFLDAPVWLRYPSPGDAATSGCDRGKEDAAWTEHRDRLENQDARRARLTEISRQWESLATEHPDHDALMAKLAEAGAAQADWAEAVLALCCEQQTLALALTLQMDVKDFYEIDPFALEDILDEIIPFAEATTLSDSLFDEFVLSPRILFQAGTLDWWTELPSFEDAGPQELLGEFRHRVQKAENTRGGQVATPAQSWRSGWADEASARVCLAGLLRRHGWPARVERGLQGVDYWDGVWNTLLPYPLDEDEEEIATLPEAYVAVNYFAGGAPFENIATWSQTRLTRFTDGHFEPWYTGQISEGNSLVDWELPAGDWWLFAGQRNGRGEPRFVSHPFSVSAGDRLHFEMDFGIPLDELERDDLVRREWQASRRLYLKRRGESRALHRFARSEAKLLVLTLAGHEPSIRHLEALGNPRGATLIPIQLRGVEGNRPDKRAWTLSRSEAEAFFGVKNPRQQLPLTVLIDERGETLLWLPGMRLDLGNHLTLLK